MEIVNLTPHALNFPEQGIEIKPEPTPARVSVKIEEDLSLGALYVTDEIDIPVTKNTYGEVENLPSAKCRIEWDKDNFTHIYIVSMMVCEALPDRRDLFVVNELIRDDKGIIVGAKSIARNPYYSKK